MSYRSRVLPFLATAAVALAACGGGDDATSASPGQEDGGDATASADAQGVAATVNGTEISRETLDGRVEKAVAAPQLAQMIEQDTTGAAREQIAASVLSQLIVNQLVLDGAEEMGLEVDDEAIERTREELTTEAGGEEAFEEQIAAAGIDEATLQEELRSIAALRLVREELTPEADAEAQPSAEGEPSPADAALEEWLLAQVSEAEIDVDPQIGTWDPARATVVPAGSVQAPGAGAEAPTGEAPAGGDTAPEPGTETSDEPATAEEDATGSEGAESDGG